MINSSPKYIYDKMRNNNNGHNTRQFVKFDARFEGKTERTQLSFCSRVAVLYNRLPIYIKTTVNIESFKRKTKHWVKSNMPVE